ncbi:MAG TPA: neocarzinostatin apoprotein domain-containing protein [Acidimicrobiales bacterium]|nr:neocarzinostatin apoprotein domain-containing protein [Acidimicrobiales bacterium]
MATLALASMATFGVVTASAASATVAVTPSTGLLNGQTVAVTGSGLPAGTHVYILECVATATSSAGCNLGDAAAAPATALVNADGTLSSTNLVVTTGTIGNGTCGTSTADLTCLVVVSNGTATLATSPITFALVPSVTATPSTGLIAGDSVAITGSNFTPGLSVYAIECLATATSQAGCDLATTTPITVGTDGTLPSTAFHVESGTIGTGTCGTTAADAKDCVITVATSTGTDVGATPIAFAVAGAAPTVVVTPNTGLTNSQQVVITGTGFSAGATVAVVECIATATTVAGCDVPASPVTAVVNVDGTLPSTNFAVQTGAIGNGTCGTSATDLNCAIVIGTLTGVLVADTLITFALVPSVTATPATGLKNGDSVTITGSDFTAGLSVYAIECLASATGQAGCDVATATPITVGADGTLPSTTFKVATGTIGTGTCGTTAANAKDCVINVATVTGTDAGTTPIAFTIAVVVHPAPKAIKTTGAIIPGRTTKVVITGRHFTGRPRIAGHAGTTATVTAATASRLTVRVKEAVRARKGTYVFTLTFSSGKKARVKYIVK